MPVFLSLLIFFSITTHATVFMKQTVAEQVQDADGIVLGHYLKSKTVELEDGSLATQVIIKMTQEMGMQSDFLKMDEIIVHYPGGTKDGRTVRVDGVPRFVEGEKVAIMIKNTEDRYWGMNLGMGAFKIIKYGKENILVNTVFPEDKKIGQISLEEFETTVRKVKGTDLRFVYSPIEIPSTSSSNSERKPASVEKEEMGKNRTIASEAEELQNQENKSAIEMGWFVAILALLGGYYQLKRKGNNH